MNIGKRNNTMLDYFLLHDFMSIVLEKYEEDWKENLSALYVGSEELEAMLLVVWSLLKKND